MTSTKTKKLPATVNPVLLGKTQASGDNLNIHHPEVKAHKSASFKWSKDYMSFKTYKR